MAWKVPEQYRIKADQNGLPGEPFGWFKAASPDKSRVTKTVLVMMASPGSADVGVEWEHVSVRAVKNFNGRPKNYIPTWAEMCFVKSLFWDASDRVIQFHPSESEYVNTHEFVLHLWRPTSTDLPTPPKTAV